MQSALVVIYSDGEPNSGESDVKLDEVSIEILHESEGVLIDWAVLDALDFENHLRREHEQILV